MLWGWDQPGRRMGQRKEKEKEKERGRGGLVREIDQDGPPAHRPQLGYLLPTSSSSSSSLPKNEVVFWALKGEEGNKVGLMTWAPGERKGDYCVVHMRD